MTIALGTVPTPISGNTSGTGVISTASFNTNASGSLFVIGVQAAASSTIIPSDSKGNTYTLIGSIENDAIDGIESALYYCQNAVGGTGMTASVGSSASNPMVLYFAEITGIATSASLDQNAGSAAIVSPYNAAVTTTVANEIVIGFCSSANGSAVVPNGSFTAVSGSPVAGTNMAYRIVSSTGTYNPAWTFTPSGGRGNVITASFKQASGVVVRPSQFFLGAQLLPLAPLGWIIGRRNKLSGIRKS